MLAPQISVVTAVYNGEKYLQEVIESVLSQHHDDFEYIVVNDGSTDGTAGILEKHLSANPDRLTVLSQSNSGEAEAVNNGINLARGEFVVIVSADDPLLPGHLAKLSQVLHDNVAVVVAYPDWEVIDENGNPTRIVITLDYDVRALVGDFVCIPGPGAMIRRSAIPEAGLRNSDYRFVSDYDAWLRLALIGPFQRVPEVLAQYRIHPGQATSTGRGRSMADEIEAVIRRFFASQVLPEEIAVMRRRAEGFAAYYAGLQALRSAGTGGKRRMIRSLALAFPRRVYWQTHRRDPIAIAAVLFLPRPHVMFRWWSKWRS
jgi:glycosyltransferase involved in cell wall biosynthesis